MSKFTTKFEKYFAQFVKTLRLTEAQEKKLLAVVADYDDALETAKDLSPGRQIEAPSKEEVITKIMNLGAEKLGIITAVMGKPALIIEPANLSITQIQDNMNLEVNLHYERQAPAYFPHKDDQWSQAKEKVTVSIVDMIQHPPVVQGQEPGKQRNDEQLRACEKYFKQQFSDGSMRLIRDSQWAVAMQRSLRAYKKAKYALENYREKYIMDYWRGKNLTATMFNQEDNATINKVVYGLFDVDDRRVKCTLRWPGNQRRHLRGRGAVQII